MSGNASTFTSNAGLFGKVYFPRLTIPISHVLSNAIRFLIQMSIVALLIVYYLYRGLLVVHPLRQLIILNPVTMPVELFRWAMLGTGTLNVSYIIISFIFTAVVFLLGVVMFNRVKRTFMDTV